ncbi:Hypothetical predicted protein [Pelobates cultripes]|uniref:Uncharacterized protein n=1 Tax=Pelobates cultripes TaxID=61616 RepID=A0AAD1W3N2_PELCU|nr:Hypothetical predicted protein [Pelobates cultripes]
MEVISVHNKQLESLQPEETQHQDRRTRDATKIATANVAGETPERYTDMPDYEAKLTAIFEAFWARLEHRAQLNKPSTCWSNKRQETRNLSNTATSALLISNLGPQDGAAGGETLCLQAKSGE